MKPSNNPLGWDVWRRGGALGLIWLGLFAAITIVIYVVMGVTGWEGTARALCAMLIGPVIGIVLIIGWWALRRPMLAPTPADRSDREGDENR